MEIRELRLVVDEMAAAVTYCGSDLRYLWVSYRYAKWLGKTPEQIVGRSIPDVIGQAGWEGIQPYVERALAGHRVEYVDQVTFEGLGRRWIHAEYTPVPNGWIAVVTDIDKQKRAELALEDANQRLLEADRRKSQFLTMLSHELRNPLAPIQTSIDILEAAPAGSDHARRALQVLHRQCEHLSRLVGDLLDVTRFASGRVTLQRVVLDLDALVQRVVEDYRGQFAAAGVDLEITMPRMALWVDGDATRLSQLMGNLLQNALKFTPRGGKASVSAVRDSTRDQAIVRIQDTGRGIASEDLALLFEPFVQADETLDRKLSGLGLGLAIARSVVEMHGGSIWAESAGIGRGATFTFRLPLRASTRAEAPEVRRRDEVKGAAMRILIVEDNIDAADALRDALELSGYETKVAYTGREGIEQARGYRPDVVVCDIGLPEMDGYQVARAIRSSPELANIELVALSGYGMPDDVAKAKSSGFDAHLTKPVTIDALKNVLSASHH